MSNLSNGTLFIVSAPSGAGKSSLLHATLIESRDDLQLSVSHTTRPPRPGEEDGLHYNFITVEQFEADIGEDCFLEYAKVFDNYYGTSETWVRETLKFGKDVILEIDWQGAQLVRKKIPEAVSIFILPPSQAALRERLTGRRQDTQEVIERRLQDAASDMAHYGEYDHLIINDEFDHAKEELKAIFLAQRTKLAGQHLRHQRLLEQLVAESS